LDHTLLMVEAGVPPGQYHCDGVDSRILSSIISLDDPKATTRQTRTTFADVAVPTSWSSRCTDVLPKWPPVWDDTTITNLSANAAATTNQTCTFPGALMHRAPASSTSRFLLFGGFAVFTQDSPLPSLKDMPDVEQSRNAAWHYRQMQRAEHATAVTAQDEDVDVYKKALTVLLNALRGLLECINRLFPQCTVEYIEAMMFKHHIACHWLRHCSDALVSGSVLPSDLFLLVLEYAYCDVQPFYELHTLQGYFEHRYSVSACPIPVYCSFLHIKIHIVTKPLTHFTHYPQVNLITPELEPTMAATAIKTPPLRHGTYTTETETTTQAFAEYAAKNIVDTRLQVMIHTSSPCYTS
jgi:hypothetical protein